MKEIILPPMPLTDEVLDGEFRELVPMLLDAFDSKTQQSAEMRQIITYFDQKVIPPLLEAFGFEVTIDD